MKARSFFWVAKFLFSAAPSAFLSLSVTSLIQALTSAGALVLLQKLVDGAGLSATWLVTLAVGYIVLALVMPNALGILSSLFREQVVRRSQVELTSRILQKASSIGLDRLENAGYQNLLGSVTRADSAVLINYWLSVSDATLAVVRLVSVAGVLFTFYWGIPLMLGLAVLPELVMRFRYARLQHKLWIDQSVVERRSYYYAGLLTDRDSIKEVRTYDLENFLYEKWAEQKRDFDTTQYKFELKRQTVYGSGQLLFLTAVSVSMFVMLTWVLDGKSTVGAFTSAVFALNYVMMSLDSLLFNLSVMQNNRLMVETTLEFLHDPDVEQDPAQAVQPVKAPFEITFDRVTFQYPEAERPALEEISFTIHTGEKIALVGANGSGKSTLIRLLLGLSQPTSGQILINGVPLQDISLEEYRRLVTAAFQDFARYYRTVQENIAFGDLTALGDLDRIEKAAEQSGADSFVKELTKGYQQQLGAEFAEGVDLSGGQWQKLAIARAYIRQAACLVMDEPTASLDPVAEVEVYRQFSELAAGRTALLVSHRLGSATLADRILVLRGGRLIESGTHSELLEAEGEYHALFTAQAEWYRHQSESEEQEQHVLKMS